MSAWLATLLLLGAAADASGETRGEPETDPVKAAQLRSMDELRAEIASEIQLQAYDLLDELVYGWTVTPPYAEATPVVLANVTVPISLGTGMRALIENHFAALVTSSPQCHVRLVHCAPCTQVVVHSGKDGTTVTRGYDAPRVLEELGKRAGSQHALFLDFTAEGPALVLRARITSIEPDLPIEFARTLTTSTSTPALLRAPDDLKSAQAAREEYLAALRGSGVWAIPTRIGVRAYAARENAGIRGAPMIWAQTGVEVGLTEARAWTGGLSVGGSYGPGGTHTGWLLQARISRLLSGRVRSLTQPDIYAYVGGSLISLTGNAVAAFLDETPDIPTLIAAAAGAEPSISFFAWQLGMELRIKNRIGVSTYLEAAPSLNHANAIGRWFTFILQFQTLGAEISVWF